MFKGIPSVLLIVMVVIAIYSYITSNTTTGRYFYAVGGNEKATRLSGINTNKTYFLAYMNMGFLAALAGMITIARMTSAQPTYGQNYEMDAIASCFIGGASAYGGIGTVPGVIIGAVLMGVINLGMFLMGANADLQKIIAFVKEFHFYEKMMIHSLSHGSAAMPNFNQKEVEGAMTLLEIIEHEIKSFKNKAGTI